MAYTTRFGKLVRLHNSFTRAGKRIKEAPPEPTDKGELGGRCNRSSCLRPGARWFNHSTRKHYCRACAEWLNTDPFNKRDAMKLYGHDLCTLVAA